jgi:hypothetical protein
MMVIGLEERMDQQFASVGRRGALSLGVAGLLLGAESIRPQAAESGANGAAPAGGAGALPTEEIEKALKAGGRTEHGLFHVSVARKDLAHVTGASAPNWTGGRIPYKPGFEINGDFWFQSLGPDKAIMNCDFAFLADEIDPAIDAMIKHELVLQAYHQHYPGLDPAVWFMHFRGVGHPVDIAQAIAEVIRTTRTPLPQEKRPHQSSPLDHERLGKILGGHASEGSEGAVTVMVPRVNPMTLAGYRVSPFLNIAINIHFEPLGKETVVSPDFGMVTGEVMPVMQKMRSQGWAVGCLYNQETDEDPQLFWSHQIKVGDPYQLAEEVRRGLDLMDVAGSNGRTARR